MRHNDTSSTQFHNETWYLLCPTTAVDKFRGITDDRACADSTRPLINTNVLHICVVHLIGQFRVPLRGHWALWSKDTDLPPPLTEPLWVMDISRTLSSSSSSSQSSSFTSSSSSSSSSLLVPLGAPMLVTWWVKIATYLHLETFLLIAYMLLILDRSYYSKYYYYYAIISYIISPICIIILSLLI
jgi:hypothetical protein